MSHPLLEAFYRLLGRIPQTWPLLYPFYLAGRLDVVQDTFFHPALPEAFDGLRLALATDIHYGPYFQAQRAVQLSQTLQSLQPDLLILGGDYGMDARRSIEFFSVFPKVEAPLGCLALIGNHDRAGSKEELAQLTQAISRWGAAVLNNQHWCLQRAGSSIIVYGVDDFRKGHPDLQDAARHITAGGFSLFLSHSPDVLPQVFNDAKFRPGLCLCGHTHGGQIALFGRSLHSSSLYGDRYRSGWLNENGVDILVSNGVGTSLLPVRLGARPQVHCITLRRGPAQTMRSEG